MQSRSCELMIHHEDTLLIKQKLVNCTWNLIAQVLATFITELFARAIQLTVRVDSWKKNENQKKKKKRKNMRKRGWKMKKKREKKILALGTSLMISIQSGAGFRICFFSVMKSRLLARFSFCARVIFTLRWCNRQPPSLSLPPVIQNRVFSSGRGSPRAFTSILVASTNPA